jgi:murein DD-endopeptidase MepM/ murein hydrolase activator NlpD
MQNFHRLLHFEKNVAYFPIDLSTENVSKEQIPVHNAVVFEHWINAYLHKNKSDVAYGGYLEKRNLYQSHNLFETNAQPRNIHLGIDLWAAAETPVCAALDATIFAIAEHTSPGDYGPMLILEHSIENKTFYTLYGHLSRASLQNKSIGQRVSKGDIIAYLGDASVNGGYAPHLHFQIISKMEPNAIDFPGVCSEAQVSHFKDICPDPLPFMEMR